MHAQQGSSSQTHWGSGVTKVGLFPGRKAPETCREGASRCPVLQWGKGQDRPSPLPPGKESGRAQEQRRVRGGQCSRESSSVLGEMEGLAQKDISTQAPGGGGESHRPGGTVSWAGHSPKRKPRCRVSFTVTGFSTVSVWERMLLHTYYAPGIFLNRLIEQVFQLPQQRGLTGQTDLPPRSRASHRGAA